MPPYHKQAASLWATESEWLSSQTKTEVMNDKKDLGKGLICLSDS